MYIIKMELRYQIQGFEKIKGDKNTMIKVLFFCHGNICRLGKKCSISEGFRHAPGDFRTILGQKILDGAWHGTPTMRS